MDAKNKAVFLNSVAAGQVVPCPKCGAANKPDSRFCGVCGADMTAKSAPAFAAVTDKPAAVEKEPLSVFAEGLPAWDIVPPQVMVRRH